MELQTTYERVVDSNDDIDLVGYVRLVMHRDNRGDPTPLTHFRLVNPRYTTCHLTVTDPPNLQENLLINSLHAGADPADFGDGSYPAFSYSTTEIGDCFIITAGRLHNLDTHSHAIETQFGIGSISIGLGPA